MKRKKGTRWTAISRAALGAMLCAALCGTAACGMTAAKEVKADPAAVSAQAAGQSGAEQASEAVSGAMDEFTASTAAVILPAAEGKNALYSPVSLYHALAMTAETSAGETLSQTLSLLGVESVEELRAGLPVLLEQLTGRSEGELALAASFWMREDFPFRQEPVDRLAAYYGAEVYQADFSNPSLPDAVARWVRDKTGGRLGDAVDFQPDPNTAAYLFSTLYFKGSWDEAFSAENNEEGPFYLADGGTADAVYMTQWESAGYVEGENFAAAGLNFRGGGEMYFILPDEGVSPAELAADPDALAAALFPEERESALVGFRVPKFTVSDSLAGVQEYLKPLGMTDAFDDTCADFTPLIDNPALSLYISDIRQETTLTIDEEGCEGAAYTKVEYSTSGAEYIPPRQVELNLNRPFLFAVRAHGGVLFVGIVENPASEG